MQMQNNTSKKKKVHYGPLFHAQSKNRTNTPVSMYWHWCVYRIWTPHDEL